MLEINVYGKPGCQQCTATTRHLARLGLPYAYRDVTQDPLWADTVTALGYQSLPVVTVGDLHWSGYRHDRLQRLAQIHADAPDVAVLEPAATAYLLAEEGEANA
ncbi:glutaredoxin family protein [Nocardia sp. NPDC050712]|uniref:glutaredoxin family protein n=1 Tax=Nocardia sp. NPDC050712 TaxID=3155518 RepID=UPI0033F0EAED